MIDSLSAEQQQAVWQGFRDSLIKMDDTLDRICNAEPGFNGLPQYEGLTDEKVVESLEQLISQCDGLIYKMGSIIESNTNENLGAVKK